VTPAAAEFVIVQGDEVRLREADLRRTEFRRSDLGGADARDADLTGAALIDADLRGSRLDGATWATVVCPDGTKSGGDRRESCAGHLTPARC
jgi:uncharacterized protein YjbI with pentapeptide repeats